MKSKIFTIFILLATAEISLAQAILIRSAAANKTDYMRYLSEAPDMISPVDYARLSIVNNSTMETSVFALADSLNQSSQEVLMKIEEVASKAPLSATSLQFLVDLLRRIQLSSKTKIEKESVREYICKVEHLSRAPSAISCQTTRIEVEVLFEHFPFAEAVFLESQEIRPHNNMQIVAEQRYNWTLSSNAYQSIRFYGTLTELLNQTFTPQPLVVGHCMSYDIQMDSALKDRTVAFFSAECIRSSADVQKSSNLGTWFSDNRKWLIPAGLLLAGGIALSLKDKTLILDISF